MSRFNTGNPLDSDDLRDLSDNAKNFDQAINSEAETFVDRKGRTRLSWARVEEMAVGALGQSCHVSETLDDAKSIEGAIDGDIVLVKSPPSIWVFSVQAIVSPNDVTVSESSGSAPLFLEMASGTIEAPANSSLTTHPQSIACFEVKVPSDFPRINDALDYLRRFKPGSNTWVDILLEDGFVMEEQVFVSAENLGWVTIFAVDNDRTININGPSLTENRTQGVYGVVTRAAFTVVQGGQGPRIGCKFNMVNGGAPELRRIGLFVSGPGSGCNMMNFRAFTNCGDTGVYANRGAYINCYGVDVSGCGAYGVYANRATMDAQQVNADDCGGKGILALYNAKITAIGGSAVGSGVRASFSSEIVFSDGVATDCSGSAINADQGSKVIANNADASGASGVFGRGVDSQRGSVIVFGGGKANDCSQYGIHAAFKGEVFARECEAKRAGMAGVQASSGGNIDIGSSDARRVDGETGSQDIRVLSGGYITAVGADGGTNVTPLEIGLSGIIIK